MLGLDVRLLTPVESEEAEKIRAFLELNGLVFEEVPDASVVVEDQDGRIVGTGSLKDNVLKMFAIDPAWQEAGLSGTIATRLVEHAREKGMTHLFVFTRPDSAFRFKSMGFRELARYGDEASVLEMGHPGIDQFREYLAGLKAHVAEGGVVGAVVVNCNPFTLGHQYLIQEASKRSDHLYIIVVEADRSSFPFRHRFQLVKSGTSHLPNVTVLRSGDYAVSPATFPSYFMKGASAEKVASVQARLDVTMFANLFVPELGIKRRFVGTEPYCPVTGSYNSAMKDILPSKGVEVVEIERLRLEDGTVVSASTVRNCIKKDDWDCVRHLVPEVTWEYLRSEEAKPVLENLKRHAGRH
ncbi:MAG: [citrate (pro-3S)-lyase] ligase [Synergistales bacterium]|nr:[citrate (pro-3S)-lyase] ligase [Synergistales bacterium]MDN5336319.1 [citrate (pro-3S)-lyase] ligase [Synergistales bacterium]